MSFRHPPNGEDEGAGPLSSERTMVQPTPGEAAAVDDPTAPSNYVLERGVDSQGSPPLLFHAGQQHGPVSLGRGGEFRIDGRGVLATHGYLMFDGEGIYLCSADEANPILADSARIPREWTRVSVPCALLFGRSRAVLRRDGFLPDKPSAGTATTPYVPPSPTRSEAGSDAPTNVRRGARGPEPLETAATPYAGFPAAAAAPRGGLPKDMSETYRPQAPSRADDESTRMGPDLASMAPQLPPFRDDESTRMQADILPHGAPARPDPRPAAGYVAPPVHDLAYAPPPQLSGYTPPPPQPHYPPPQGYPPAAYTQGYAPPPYPFPPHGYAQPPPGYPQPQVPPPGYRPHDASPGYAQPTVPSPQQGYVPAPPPKPPISPDVPTAAALPTKKGPSAVQRAVESLRSGIQPGSPRRTPILVGGLSFIAIFVATIVTVVRLRATAPLPSPRAATAEPPPTAPSPPMLASAAPLAVSPGIIVYPAPARTDADEGYDAGKLVHGKTPPPPPPTLERSAVDAVNRGDLQAALNLYRQLAVQQPDNPAFANAVRLLQQRVGVPSNP